MESKTTIAIILSIGAIIGGMVLNFQEFLMGNPTTVKNLFVTLAYIAVWITVLSTGVKSKNLNIIKYCSIFWLATLLPAIITIYVNITEASVDWAIPFALLLLGQWYGVNFFVGSFLTSSIIIASISLVMLAASVVSFKRIKSL